MIWTVVACLHPIRLSAGRVCSTFGSRLRQHDVSYLNLYDGGDIWFAQVTWLIYSILQATSCLLNSTTCLYYYQSLLFSHVLSFLSKYCFLILKVISGGCQDIFLYPSWEFRGRGLTLTWKRWAWHLGCTITSTVQRPWGMRRWEDSDGCRHSLPEYLQAKVYQHAPFSSTADFPDNTFHPQNYAAAY